MGIGNNGSPPPLIHIVLETIGLCFTVCTSGLCLGRSLALKLRKLWTKAFGESFLKLWDQKKLISKLCNILYYNLGDCCLFYFQSAAVLVDLFAKYPKLYKLAIVCSFDPRIVYAVRFILFDTLYVCLYLQNCDSIYGRYFL